MFRMVNVNELYCWVLVGKLIENKFHKTCPSAPDFTKIMINLGKESNRPMLPRRLANNIRIEVSVGTSTPAISRD